MFGVDDIINTGLRIIEKVIPDPTARAEAQAKLLALQQEGQIKIEEFGLRELQISADDRKSARDRETQVKDKTPAILAALITLGFFGVLGYMLMHGLPDTGKEPLLIMLGALGAAWTGVVSYYFGSSSSSSEKNNIIAHMVKK